MAIPNNLILKGWKPSVYLTNMSMAYFQEQQSAAQQLFPICPVQQSSAHYYIFSKEDLARDNVKRKPLYGEVDPAIMGLQEGTYSCKVEQIRAGIDKIAALDYQRAGAPGMADPRRAKVAFITEQMNIHQDILFAKKFFNMGVWTNEWTGAASTNEANKQFMKFDNAKCDPVAFFHRRVNDLKLSGRRKPNKLALGVDTFAALCNNPYIIERVKYTGTTANPAVVTEQVLAQLIGVETVVVLDSTHNVARPGEPVDMQFICDTKGALLMYATNSPAIDTPSAGYIFTWDALGNGAAINIGVYDGTPGSHTEFVEGIMAMDMKKCADDLAVYMKDCVG